MNKSDKKIKPQPVSHADSISKLELAILKVAYLYVNNEEQFATAAQIALILKVAKLFPEIPDEDVGNYLLASKIPCVFRSSKAYFQISRLVTEQQKQQLTFTKGL